MVHTQSVKAFVRQTLGCNCPDEVFSLIECQSDISLNGIALSRKINIGNRLLVYVIEVDNPAFLVHTLPALVALGRKERDGSGYNRVRIVLAAIDISATRKAAEEIMHGLEKDDRLHLHVIQREHIP